MRRRCALIPKKGTEGRRLRRRRPEQGTIRRDPRTRGGHCPSCPRAIREEASGSPMLVAMGRRARRHAAGLIGRWVFESQALRRTRVERMRRRTGRPTRSGGQRVDPPFQGRLTQRAGDEDRVLGHRRGGEDPGAALAVEGGEIVEGEGQDRDLLDLRGRLVQEPSKEDVGGKGT